MRRAKPFFWRFMIGFLRPKRRILGMEFAGVVEAVGVGGDRVRRRRPRLRHAEPVRTRSTCAFARAGLIAQMPTGTELRGGRCGLRRRMTRGWRASDRARRHGHEAARLRRLGLVRNGGGAARPHTSVRTSRRCATRRTSSSCARSAPTTSSTTSARTSRRTARRTTSSSTRSGSSRFALPRARSIPGGIFVATDGSTTSCSPS